MATPRFAFLWHRRSPRPDTARGALSLLVGGCALVVALALIGRGQNRVACAAEVARPSLMPGTPDRPITFRDRLIVGLQARAKSEVAFVDAVVAKVQTGKLPERLVNQTFFWSRERASRPLRSSSTTSIPSTQRPIIYFQPVMTAQAKHLGVML